SDGPVSRALACGARYWLDQIGPGHGRVAVPDTVHGGEGAGGGVAGVQPGSEGVVPGGVGGRDASAADQFHSDVASGTCGVGDSDTCPRSYVSGVGPGVVGGTG